MCLTREECGALILAGGKASRMGCQKALLPVSGKPLVLKIKDELTAFNECRISTCDEKLVQISGLISVRDFVPDCGPMGGIYSGLISTGKEALFVVPCDMPFFNSSIPDTMLRKIPDSADAIVAKDSSGRIHPLCGIYRSKLAPLFRQHIDCGKLKMSLLLQGIDCVFCPVEDSLLFNMNTAEDYSKIK